MNLKKKMKQIEKIKKELLQIGRMRPGSLSKQYSVCGKANCRCADPIKPKKHGPYYQLSYVHKGKSTSRFIRYEFFKQIKKELVQYKKFKKLVETWVALALQCSETWMTNERINITKNK